MNRVVTMIVSFFDRICLDDRSSSCLIVATVIERNFPFLFFRDVSFLTSVSFVTKFFGRRFTVYGAQRKINPTRKKKNQKTMNHDRLSRNLEPNVFLLCSKFELRILLSKESSDVDRNVGNDLGVYCL